MKVSAQFNKIKKKIDHRQIDRQSKLLSKQVTFKHTVELVTKILIIHINITENECKAIGSPYLDRSVTLLSLVNSKRKKNV